MTRPYIDPPIDPSNYPNGDLALTLRVKQVVNFNKLVEVGDNLMKANFIAVFTGLKAKYDDNDGVTYLLCVPIIFYGENAEFMTTFFKGKAIWVAMKNITTEWSFADRN